VTPVWFGSTSQPPGLPPGQLAWGLPISTLLLRFSADRTPSGVVATLLQLTNVPDPEVWFGIVAEDEVPPGEEKRLRLVILRWKIANPPSNERAKATVNKLLRRLLEPVFFLGDKGEGACKSFPQAEQNVAWV